MRRSLILILCCVAPGVIGCAVFGFFALEDWTALQSAYAAFESAASAGADQRVLFVAEAKQNIHRINLFAEGTWTLLSAIWASIGLHGIILRWRNDVVS